jgi:crotonobetainyl-CoA:carnitine CoA-transferase CaiB-like acyl-CoA transferase
MLEGLRVVELATYIAAPGAAGIMADWGAEVIKVESPEGDPMRRFFDPSARTRTPTRSSSSTTAARRPWCWTSAPTWAATP